MHPHEQLTPLDGDVVVFEYVDDDGRRATVRVRDVLADAQLWEDPEKASDVRHWIDVGDLGALQRAAEFLGTTGDMPEGFGGEQGCRQVGVASNRNIARLSDRGIVHRVSVVRPRMRARSPRRSPRRFRARNRSRGRSADDDPHEPEHDVAGLARSTA